MMRVKAKAYNSKDAETLAEAAENEEANAEQEGKGDGEAKPQKLKTQRPDQKAYSGFVDRGLRREGKVFGHVPGIEIGRRCVCAPALAVWPCLVLDRWCRPSSTSCPACVRLVLCHLFSLRVNILLINPSCFPSFLSIAHVRALAPACMPTWLALNHVQTFRPAHLRM